VIVGLGKTGLSCARFLGERGVRVAVTDSRTHPPELERLQAELPGVELFLGGFNASALHSAERIVVSPGVTLKEPALDFARAAGVPVLGDIELFAHYTQAPVVAITGSNGKSTVTTLLGAMAKTAGLKVRVGGNLGTPALTLIEGHEPDLYVLELSSFQLESTFSLNAAAAVVLNVSPDHMDRYQSMTEYASAKARIYRGDGVMVVNADDPLVVAMAQGARKQQRFTLQRPGAGEFGLITHGAREWLAQGCPPQGVPPRRGCSPQGPDCLLPVDALRIPGRHNVANALAALCLGQALRLPLASMLEALSCFTGLPHRCEWVGEREGIRWYNDSKATNVGATIAALQGIMGPLVLIAGGDGKGADFSALRSALLKVARMGKARGVVLMGRDAPLLAAVLEGVVPLVHAGDMEEAVDEARKLAQPGDAVLLSPACASFDMYSGYEARGRAFIDAVTRMMA
jgi:UDP-N-acetylmuramoylalanine--D-glutamate ligase